MWFKIITIVILVLIVVSLFGALASLVRNKSSSGKTVKMLGYRVGFSMLLLLFLAFAKFSGWSQPHDLKGQPVSQPMISAPDSAPARSERENQVP
ncbi:MAG: DUF2909 domain-containing protein [Ketobacteraceae bacterium]|nr:DUF2909 domain-containing protein [Ketobacteraceae bacterium]